MKKVYNATNDTVSITIDGVKYTVESMGYSQELSDRIATTWKATHGFLTVHDIIKEDKNEVKVETKIETPIVVEEEEVIIKEEEVVEVKEQPKKKFIKRFKK